MSLKLICDNRNEHFRFKLFIIKLLGEWFSLSFSPWIRKCRAADCLLLFARKIIGQVIYGKRHTWHLVCCNVIIGVCSADCTQPLSCTLCEGPFRCSNNSWTKLQYDCALCKYVLQCVSISNQTAWECTEASASLNCINIYNIHYYQQLLLPWIMHSIRSIVTYFLIEN